VLVRRGILDALKPRPSSSREAVEERQLREQKAQVGGESWHTVPVAGDRRPRPVNPEPRSVRQGPGSTGGAHFLGRKPCKAQPGVVHAIVAVRAQLDRTSIALVGKQLLRHDAPELAILAEVGNSPLLYEG
jgi:hypothetical protein